jgi:hypothetical protein
MYSVGRIIKELPENYEEKCAVRRWRGVKTPADLMMLNMIHLLNGASLLETSIIARMAKLGEMSDVAYMNRLAQCKDWFITISQTLLRESMEEYRQPEWLEGRTVVAADASDVVEKGRSRRTYRLHYMLDVFKMSGLKCKITGQSTGETLTNFELEPNMLVIADRIYSTVGGMAHCMEAGADFLLRMRKNSFKACDENGNKLDILKLLKEATDERCVDFNAFAINKEGKSVPVRICAKRKTQEQIEKTMKQLKYRERKTGVTNEAKIFNEYIVVVTSLKESITAEQLLELYRLRWQVEIYFKRLKSILDFGELPKKKPENSLAWLNGKLMIALLIERVIAKSFSPDEKQNYYDFEEHLA